MKMKSYIKPSDESAYKGARPTNLTKLNLFFIIDLFYLPFLYTFKISRFQGVPKIKKIIK